MSAAFNPGSPITAGDLIEDDDGAPLPHELQRESVIWYALDRTRGVILTDSQVEALCRSLAPILWPLLPSNDHSASAKIQRVRQIADELAADIPYDAGNATANHAARLIVEAIS